MVTTVSLTNLLPICCLHGLFNVIKASIRNKGVLSSADKIPLDALVLELIM
jgi:hypothetical protein